MDNIELNEAKTEDYFRQCDVCQDLYKKVVIFNKEEFYGCNNKCEKCLKKAYLLINPITWHKGVIKGVLDNKLETLKYLSDGKAFDLIKFIKWLEPFLEDI